MSYRVRTQAYSGPFDLLLSLVSRQKVDIGQVAIAQVAEQYLAEVDAMGELDLDVASDFLLVASTLLEIKAASLVPEDRPQRQLQRSDPHITFFVIDKAIQVFGKFRMVC